ncbi:hypothetical protein ROZALSC1DRAFT_22203, partial [Rozella allomycis CSF55]
INLRFRHAGNFHRSIKIGFSKEQQERKSYCWDYYKKLQFQRYRNPLDHMWLFTFNSGLAMKTSFICEYCQKSFNRNQKLQDHLNIHTGERPYKCEKCGKTYTRQAHLHRHMMGSHSDEKMYVCECGLRYKHAYHLKRHQVTHIDPFPYKCEHEGCKLEFKRKNQLKVHLKIHEKVKTPSFRCGLGDCSLLFSSYALLLDHRKKFHSNLECDKCQKKFSSRKTLRQHLKEQHGQIVQYKCPEESCQQVFKRVFGTRFAIFVLKRSAINIFWRDIEEAISRLQKKRRKRKKPRRKNKKQRRTAR